MVKMIGVEFLKYKRTIIPWAILCSALATSLLGIFMASGGGRVGLTGSMIYGLGWLNMLSIFLLSLLTGMVFSGEYSQGTARVMFTYPIARWKLFITKFVVLFCWTLILYVLYLVFSIVAGLALGAPAPTSTEIVQAVRLVLVMPFLNYTLVTITALISIRTRWYGSFTLAAAAYIILYTSLIRSNLRFFLPMTIPNVIKDYFLGSVTIATADWVCMIVSLCVIFAITTYAGLVNYQKRDI